jgi:hypothetical protein
MGYKYPLIPMSENNENKTMFARRQIHALMHWIIAIIE